MRVPHLSMALTLLALLALSGCRRDAPETPTQAASTPDSAVQAMAEALREHDLQTAARLALPPPLHEQVALRWDQERAAAAPLDDEGRHEFAAQMQRFTEPGAEETLYAELEPQLAQWDREFAAQAPIALGMLTGLANVAIARNETLSEEQKAHAGGIIAALSGWAMEAPLTDRERAREAVAISVETARTLDLPTADDVVALDFEAALGRGGVLTQGLWRTLALYGLDLDAALAGLETEVVEDADGRALVRIDYTLAGRPLAFHLRMVERDGLWYSQDAIENAERRLAEPVGGGDDATQAAARTDARLHAAVD